MKRLAKTWRAGFIRAERRAENKIMNKLKV